MYQVVHKKTGAVRTVYGINGLYFLLWDADNQSWEYESTDNYRPVEAPA